MNPNIPRDESAPWLPEGVRRAEAEAAEEVVNVDAMVPVYPEEDKGTRKNEMLGKAKNVGRYILEKLPLGASASWQPKDRSKGE